MKQSRIDNVNNKSIEKFINVIKSQIRKVQEQDFYDAVAAIPDELKFDIVRTLKDLRKEHLGKIEIVETPFNSGVVRVEYEFKINGKSPVKMVYHCSDKITFLITEGKFESVTGVEQ
ncbi:hypothetical protein AP1_0316 [Aeromonas phage AP1]|nr:hypothetical protein AP1_0316 [Aeromonas phage AP1]